MTPEQAERNRQYQRDWRKNNPKKHLEIQRAWRAKNPEKMKKKAYRDNRTESTKIAKERWANEHRKEVNAKRLTLEYQRYKREQYAMLPEEKKAVVKERNYLTGVKERNLVLRAYGGKCTKCGFDDPRALDLDHINNDGNAHRKTKNGTSIYGDVIKAGFPNTFQLLCKNHNHIKYIENKPPRVPHTDVELKPWGE